MTAYWGFTQYPLNQGLSNDTGYESLIADYTSKLGAMPTTESGGYLGQVQTPSVTYPTMPTYNTGRERMLQQQYGAPATSKLNRGLLTALTSAQNKPLPAQSYLTREALSGYGEGLGSIMQSALSPAQRAQMAELGLEREGLLGRYNADYQNAMLKYQQDYNTAMMKEQERRTLINSLNDFQLNQSLAEYKKKQPIGSSTARLSANTMSGLNSGGYGTSAPQGVSVLTNPSQPTQQTSATQEWAQRWASNQTGNMNMGGIEPTQTPQYEPTQADYSSMLDTIIPQTTNPYGYLLKKPSGAYPSYSGLLGGY